MAANTIYIGAGLQTNRSDPPATGANTFYVSAGLPPTIEAAAGGGGVNIVLGSGIMVQGPGV